MVSLKLKLLFFLLYLLSSIYIFIKFVNSLLKPWLNKVGYINKTGYKINKIKVRVLIIVYKVGFSVILVLVLVLAKLFLKKQLIHSELNFFLAIIYFLILGSVHFINSSSYRVLNSDLGTIVFLYFFTYTLLVHRSIWSFLIYIQLQFLKIYSIKF